MSQDPNGSPTESRSRDVQSTRWCLTIYREKDYEKFMEDPGKVALVVAKEEGTKEKHDHYQIYVKYRSNKRWSHFKKMFSNEEDVSYSAHWEKAKGLEWHCRRYIVDVAAYLRDNPRAHAKTQGVVLHDYGCDVMVDTEAPIDVRVVKMIVGGARLHEVFRENPMFFFHNSYKVRTLFDYVTEWRASSYPFDPAEYESYKRRGIKRHCPSHASNET